MPSPGEGVVGRHDQDDLVGHQALQSEARPVHYCPNKAHVCLVGQHAAGHLGRIGDDHLHLGLGILLPEGSQQARQQVLAGDGAGGQGQVAAGDRLEQGQLLLERLEVGQGLTGKGQAPVPRPA